MACCSMCSLCTWKRIFIQLFTEIVHHRLKNKCADHLSIMSFGCVDTILVICYEYKHIHFPPLLLIFKTTWRTLYLHCCTIVISVPRDKLRESQIWARRRWHNFPLIPKTFFILISPLLLFIWNDKKKNKGWCVQRNESHFRHPLTRRKAL